MDELVTNAAPLIVALDVSDAATAFALADKLRGVVGAYKIGSRLFTAEGPAFVRHMVEQGDRVFLDLKYHDIPTTVAGAVSAAARLGVWMLTIHASGGVAMMKAAQYAADAAKVFARPRPIIVGITVLTSLDESGLMEIGVQGPVENQVVRLARQAEASGLDGVVSSPLEIAAIRRTVGSSFLIVTPGIRDLPPEGGSHDDQSRTMTARQALAAGASYIVVGRPIISATDPRAAAERLLGGA